MVLFRRQSAGRYLYLSVLSIIVFHAGCCRQSVSTEQLRQSEEDAVIRIGRTAAASYIQGNVMLIAPDIQNQIQALSTELCRAAGCETPCRVHIVNDPSVNLYALPSGDIFVNTGFLDVCENRDELAFAIGHEIAHIQHRHALKQMKKNIQVENTGTFLVHVIAAGAGAAAGTAATEPLAAHADGITYDLIEQLIYPRVSSMAARIPAELGSYIMIASKNLYSHEQEYEADRYGMLYMKEAGYDPQAAIGVLKKLP